MQQLKSIIQEVLLSKKTVDWLIMHDIAKHNQLPIAGIKFSLVDGKEQCDKPFATRQGYISIKEESFTNFMQIINELAIVNQDDTLLLSNLYLVITRYDGFGEELIILQNAFKECIGSEKCRLVFERLIESLNIEYFKDANTFHKNKPDTLSEWLRLFHSAEYVHNLSDPLLDSLYLVKEIGNEINYELLIAMNPFLRAVLIGKYGFILQISEDELKKEYDNNYELSFVVACLLNMTQVPLWLSQEMINICIENHWEKIGRQMFNYIFGINHRNRSDNELYYKLEELLHHTIIEKMNTNENNFKEWIKVLKFPHDFIALSSWLTYQKDTWEKISNEVKPCFIQQFIHELKRIVKLLPEYFNSENHDDPFSMFQLREEKYKEMLAHVFIFLLSAGDDDLKSIRKVCYEFKPLFYGGYKAVSLAKNFTTILLLIGLPGIHYFEVNDNDCKIIKSYIKNMAQTILIPYIHIMERETLIWEDDVQMFKSDADSCLINEYLNSIQHTKIKQMYQDVFDILQNTKVNHTSII